MYTNIRHKLFLLVSENLREVKGYNDFYGAKVTMPEHDIPGVRGMSILGSKVLSVFFFTFM
jgi:hypothetical protein